MREFIGAAIVIGCIIAGSVLLGLLRVSFTWLRWRMRLPVRFGHLTGMRLRGSPVKAILEAQYRAQQAGLDISTDRLEAHHLCGGNINKVIDAMIIAQHEAPGLVVDTAFAIDLAGRENIIEEYRRWLDPVPPDASAHGASTAEPAESEEPR